MEIVKIKTYGLMELKDEAYRRAIDNNRGILTDDFYDEQIKEAWTEKLNALGYTNVKILYSGFGSQGDGACFTATIDGIAWIKAHKKSKQFAKLLDAFENGEASGAITHQWRYYFATSTSVNIEYLGEADKEANEMELLIEAERAELGNKIYKELYDEYDHLQEEDCVADHLMASEVKFLENGEVFNAKI